MEICCYSPDPRTLSKRQCIIGDGRPETFSVDLHRNGALKQVHRNHQAMAFSERYDRASNAGERAPFDLDNLPDGGKWPRLAIQTGRSCGTNVVQLVVINGARQPSVANNSQDAGNHQDGKTVVGVKPAEHIAWKQR